MEAAQVSISTWVDKTSTGHLHSGILLVGRKKNIFSFVTVWMDLENIMLSETSQSEKDKGHMFHSYVESNEQTELTSKTKTNL